MFPTTSPNTAHVIVHAIGIVSFAFAIAYAWGAVSKLKHTSDTYNVRLLPFAYYSFGAWIFWGLQYALLIASPFLPKQNDVFVCIGLSLGVLSNALWASAVFSLSLQKFSPMWVASPLLIATVIAFRAPVVTSPNFVVIDANLSAAILTAFAYSILQLRQSKIIAGSFFIHALSQWGWRFLWFIPFDKTQFALLVAFPLWHIALLWGWTILISAIVEKGHSYPQVVEAVEQPESSSPLNTLEVMISSTVEDLKFERDAAERAISGLRLVGLRAEALASLPHAPIKVCELLANRCDIFVLIIGERYGYVIKPEDISVVEFEYNTARAQNKGKILVYVKDGVVPDDRLKKFCDEVTDIRDGYFRNLFTTPEELTEKIQAGVMQWLIDQAKRRKPGIQPKNR